MEERETCKNREIKIERKMERGEDRRNENKRKKDN
jgi:hypothetical protein